MLRGSLCRDTGAMTESDEPIASVADFPNGRRKYEGFLLDGEMHGTWTW
jgi:hypothetical protein